MYRAVTGRGNKRFERLIKSKPAWIRAGDSRRASVFGTGSAGRRAPHALQFSSIEVLELDDDGLFLQPFGASKGAEWLSKGTDAGGHSVDAWKRSVF